ncbi:chemotaxis protein CheW [Trichothermofontia sp.]
MTSASHYLIFDLNQCRYGIATSAVQEIFFLPALIPIAEAPADIVGILNLRGEILPVIDLNRRFGRMGQPYQLTNSVIVLQADNLRAGVIVDRVYDVELIQRDRTPIDLTYGRGEHLSTQRFVTDLVEVGAQIVTLLDAAQILRYSETLQVTDTEMAVATASVPDIRDRAPVTHAADPNTYPIAGFAQVSPAAWQAFQQRAENLRYRTEQVSKVGLQPFAVVNLQGELFGIGLDAIHEFTEIQMITPIPCCPQHIVGNINLRGEVVTLIDISYALNLTNNGIQKHQAMLIHLDGIVAGIAVDEVLDVVYVNPRDVQPIPAALHTGHDEYLDGVAPYRSSSMSLLDLPKLFLKGSLVVNEEV